ncbi:MAG: glycosyltransferase family 4 protein [Chloroflexi bacterium]|nr:glycosyltransferase family 4 protein [Chloroflexota bacterium]
MLAFDQQSEFVLYFRQPPGRDDFPPSARVVQQVIMLPRLWTHVRLSLEMLRDSPDVLFVPAHVLPIVHPPRTVVTIHDLGYLYHRHAHRTVDWLYLYLSTLYNARAASAVIADSEATKRDLVRKHGISPDKIVVVHLAHEERFHPTCDPDKLEAARAKYGINADYLLCLGTLQPRKNITGILSAFGALKRRLGVPHKLVVAGKQGWLSEALVKRAKALGIEDEVVFTGYVSEDDLVSLLNGATALVFLSLYEGFGLPALEAMACGTPVIASNVSSLPEVIDDAGILVDPLDAAAVCNAMIRVVTDVALRQQLRANGIRRASQFSWQKCSEQTLRVLYHVVESSRPA